MNFDVPAMFTSVFTLSAIGIIASLILRSLQRKVVYWEKETSTHSVGANGEH